MFRKKSFATLGLKPLSVRRLELCEGFAASTAADKSRHSELFQLVKTGPYYTRSDNIKYREHMGNKNRFFKALSHF